MPKKPKREFNLDAIKKHGVFLEAKGNDRIIVWMKGKVYEWTGIGLTTADEFERRLGIDYKHKGLGFKAWEWLKSTMTATGEEKLKEIKEKIAGSEGTPQTETEEKTTEEQYICASLQRILDFVKGTQEIELSGGSVTAINTELKTMFQVGYESGFEDGLMTEAGK